MDSLLGRLAELAYEFFGVILPGFITFLFLMVLWLAIGPMVGVWTLGHVPELTIARIGWWHDELTDASRVEWGLLLLVVCYFLGQAVNWYSRPDVDLDKEPSWRKRIWLFLTRRTPKLKKSHSENLDRLYESAQKKLVAGDERWTSFYPVAKALIAQRLERSLLSTFQHKYTLHRSIAAASALLFHLSLGAIVISAISKLWTTVSPNWFWLAVLALLSLFLVNAFAASYLFFWKLWGNTVVTEAHTAILMGDERDARHD